MPMPRQCGTPLRSPPCGDGAEVAKVTGRTADGAIATVQVIPEGSPVANYAFDVTPARLVTGLVTERGVAAASGEGLLSLVPERRKPAWKPAVP